jgi:hypothetical protein
MAQFEVLRVYLFYFSCKFSFFFLKKNLCAFFFFNSRVNCRSK